MNDFFGPPTPSEVFLWRKALVAFLLAFALGQSITSTYVWVFRGLSYSRTLVRGMAIASIVTCMLMLAVGNSVAAGIGIVAAVNGVRFRTSLRDPHDVVFFFATLATGMACGMHAYGVAVAGTLVFIAAVALLHFTGFGVRRQADGLLRFVATPGAGDLASKVLKSHCRLFTLVTLREAAQGEVLEHAYQVSTWSTDGRDALVSELRAVPGVTDVALMLQDPSLEV